MHHFFEQLRDPPFSFAMLSEAQRHGLFQDRTQQFYFPGMGTKHSDHP